jgi:hypothetical protein
MRAFGSNESSGFICDSEILSGWVELKLGTQRVSATVNYKAA